MHNVSNEPKSAKLVLTTDLLHSCGITPNYELNTIVQAVLAIKTLKYKEAYSITCMQEQRNYCLESSEMSELSSTGKLHNYIVYCTISQSYSHSRLVQGWTHPTK